MDLNQAEQGRLEMVMQKKQQKEFMKMFFRVTADCFDTCVTDFSSKALSAREVSCPLLVHTNTAGSMYQEMYRQVHEEQ